MVFMKLVRYGDAGMESPGVIVDDRLIDASGEFSQFDEGFFAADGLVALESWVRAGCDGGYVVEQGVRLGAPISRPSKIVCVGLNYAAHAEEFGGENPPEPVLFMKASSAFSGPFDDVVIPAGATQLDYEVELAVVIGRTAKGVTEESAAEYVAGFCVIGDYSEREYQKHHGGQWTKGKSADTFAPMGPCLVTCDEVENINEVRIWTKVNGELIPKAEFARLLSRLAPVALTMEDRPTPFEVVTAAAFEYFREKGVDLALVEVGLGGRFDATNVLKPLLTILTNVGPDHLDLLGPTLADVAWEKAGIAKEGVPLLTGERTPELLQIIV